MATNALVMQWQKAAYDVHKSRIRIGYRMNPRFRWLTTAILQDTDGFAQLIRVYRGIPNRRVAFRRATRVKGKNPFKGGQQFARRVICSDSFPQQYLPLGCKWKFRFSPEGGITPTKTQFLWKNSPQSLTKTEVRRSGRIPSLANSTSFLTNEKCAGNTGTTVPDENAIGVTVGAFRPNNNYNPTNYSTGHKPTILIKWSSATTSCGSEYARIRHHFCHPSQNSTQIHSYHNALPN